MDGKEASIFQWTIYECRHLAAVSLPFSLSLFSHMEGPRGVVRHGSSRLHSPSGETLAEMYAGSALKTMGTKVVGDTLWDSF
jgi:hypothetical protein